MTSLGLKIVGAEMEVGFTASTREEFDSFVARLRMMADTVWPKEHAPEPQDSAADRYVREHAEVTQREVVRDWRDSQGLR